MYQDLMRELMALTGNEAMQYGQWMKLFGTREKTADILSPRYNPIGDLMLPRNALIHYQQHLPGEVGPSNTAPFISNYDKRVNMYFNPTYETILGVTKIENRQISAIIKNYEGSHFIYSRTRNPQGALAKEGELFVNNLAIGQVPVVYRRQTVFTPFQRSYNNMYTLLDSVNSYAEAGRQQFIEIKLPRVFPTFKKLQDMFARYKKNFFDEEGGISKYDKQTLVPFQAEQSFWLLDLYGILMGYDDAKYSIFNRLTDKARAQLEIIFIYNGKCWVVNLQNVINLLSYSDQEKDTEAGSLHVNYFKRFYLSLIGLVTPIIETEEPVNDGQDEEETEQPDNDSGRNGRSRGTKGSEEDETVLEQDTPVGDRPGTRTLADLYASPKTSDNVPDDTSGRKGEEVNPEAPSDGDDVPTDAWGQDISDDVFEQASVENVAISTSHEYTPTSSIERELTQLAAAGQLTTKEKDFFVRASNSYKEIEIGGRTLEEIIDIKPEELVLDHEDIAPDSIVVRDKSALKSRTVEMSRTYNEKFLTRNIMESMLFGAQNGKIALIDMSMEQTTTADSKFDTYTVRLQGLKGSQSTRRIRIPRVDKDGTFLMNGVRSYMQIMRMEKPIRKIKPTKVALTSYYDKKIMVERSTKKVDDYARWLKAAIIEASYLDKSIQVSLGGYKSDKEKVCYYYSVLAGRFKAIDTPEYHFDFNTAELIANDKSLDKLCTENSWVIGKKGNDPILIDSTGLVTVGGVEVGYIEEILKLNTAKAPVPTATININGYQFPAIVVLSYWIGFSNVIKMLAPEFRVVPADQRPQLSIDEYMVVFADERLVFNRRDELTTLIMSGLRKLSNLQNFTRSNLDDPNIWFGLIGDSRVKPTHFKEMSQIYDQFVDPITKRELVKMGYPFMMDELIVEATKLLLSNEAKQEIEITEQRFVGYERFAGHVYREMVKATRAYRNKPNNVKKTVDINPEAVMMNIITDSSVQAAEEVNPIHQLKIQEEVTFGGTMGRSDRVMVRRTRGQMPNYEGIISEAGKDSGKVGYISYLTSDAKLVDVSGNVDTSLKTPPTGRGSVVMNLLYGTTKDDTKRTLFSGVQQSQVMASDNYVINPLRTSYDSVVAYRTSEMYSSFAKQDGVIKEIKPEGILVEYADGSEGRFPLGYSIGKGAGEYHRHVKITDMTVGQKFVKGEILAWDEGFFDRDPLDKKRVVWKSGGLARIALIEDQFTFEDSVGISKKFAERSTTPYLKPVEFKVRGDQSIKLHVKVGDMVEYDQILCDVEEPVSAVFDDPEAQQFEALDRLGIKQVHAKQSGKISRIDVEYNGEVSTWSETMQAFVKKFDGVRAKEAAFKDDEAKTGNVALPGNTKSKIYPDTAVIQITIDNKINTTTADKFVVGNQMKGTVGFIYEAPIYTVDGREVDITFSLKSLLNRMVLSLRDKLVANEINNVYTQRLINKYGKY